MMLPPAILRLRVVENRRRKMALWLPIFLFWPPLLLLIVASLPLILLLALPFSWHPKARKVVRSIVPLFGAVCSLRGFTVNVESEEEEVLIKII